MNKELEKVIASSKSVVFFGGAGVSTESGIPDFRSADGLHQAAASFIDYFRGNNLVLINRDETARSVAATLVIHDKIGIVFES